MNFKSKIPPQSDLQIWQQMKDGSEFALGNLMKMYFNPLLNYGYKFVKDEDFVKDCVQEVFIEIWKRRERLSLPDSVKAYLLSSVRKKVVREGFRQKIDKEEYELDLENNVNLIEYSFEFSLVREEEEKQLNEKIKKILDTLPKRQREVIYLQYYQNLTRDEIAKIMDINQQSVSNLLQAAFKSFRENWEILNIILVSFIKS